jgi:glycine betaine/proline transport system substrate-binding protein
MISLAVLGTLGLGVNGLAGVAQADDLPGAGKEVKMARPTWDTGWFQTAMRCRR